MRDMNQHQLENNDSTKSTKKERPYLLRHKSCKIRFGGEFHLVKVLLERLNADNLSAHFYICDKLKIPSISILKLLRDDLCNVKYGLIRCKYVWFPMTN